jgi:predicted metalloendopeptidase
MVHAFDEDGKNYDEKGIFKYWWSKKDLKNFRLFSKKLVDLYSSSKIYSISISGKKTLSENLADLGGLSIALEALKKEISSLNDSEKKEELKQFFISYAVSWRTKEEKQKVLQSLFMDAHAPPEFRVNNIVVHFDEWYYAFDIQLSNHLYVPPEERIRVF